MLELGSGQNEHVLRRPLLCCAPRVWNGLPDAVRNSALSFAKLLKTYRALPYVGRGAFDVELAPYEINFIIIRAYAHTIWPRPTNFVMVTCRGGACFNRQAQSLSHTATKFYTVIKLDHRKNFHRLDHARSPGHFLTQMLTRDLVFGS